MKKNKRRILKILKIIIIVFVVAGAITGAGFFLTRPYFDIGLIEATGYDHCLEAEIIAASGLKTGKNVFGEIINNGILHMFLLRYHKAELEIEASTPYVRSAVVRLKLPSRILIEIQERKPVFRINFIGKTVFIDNEMVVLEASGTAISEDLQENSHSGLPLLKGLVFERYEIGKPLSPISAEGFGLALRLLDAAAEYDKEKESDILAGRVSGMLEIIGRIDISDARHVRVLLDSRITADFGRLEDIRYRIAFTGVLMADDLKDGKGLLDFTVGENPVFTPEY